MATKEELQGFFKNVDEDKKQFAFDTIDEYLFFRERLAELKQYPALRVSKTDPMKQQVTPAAKLIREYSQAVDSKRKQLLMILYRVETSAADELLAKLAEFE